MMRSTGKSCLPIIALLCLGVEGRLQGQVPTMGAVFPSGTTAAPVTGGGSTEFEQYSAFNGNLNISIPLHHIQGRGDLGFDLVWNTQPGWLAAYNGKPSNWFLGINPFPNPNIASPNPNSFGFGGPGGVYVRTGYSWKPCNPYYGVATTLTTIVYVLPNGSQLNLTDTATGGAAANAPSNSCSSLFAAFDAGRGTTFRSRDGSQIQFVASSNVQELQDNGHGYGTAKVSGTLMFPNGATYTVANSVITSMQDRNGNTISLTYSNATVTYLDWYVSVPSLTQIQDSFTRITTINYNDTCSGNSCLTITYPGTAGAPRQVHVITRQLASTLRSGYNVMSIGYLFPTSNQDTGSNFNPTVACNIVRADGKQYALQYNSWGELARLSIPSDQSPAPAFEYDYGDGAGGANNGFQQNGSGGAVMIYRRLQERREYMGGGTGNSYSLKTVSIT